MKPEYIVVIICAALIANTYYDGKLLRMMQSNQKYMKMGAIAFVGFMLLIFSRKNPEQSRQLMYHANDMIKYMPISKGTADIISPLFDLTNNKSFFSNNSETPVAQKMMAAYMATANNQNQGGGGGGGGGGGPIRNGLGAANENKILSSGKNSTKRSVSETKKKYVAANQSWRCGDCQRQLPAWFEVDHVIRLEHGGSNHVSNLVALCRDCHGKKTAIENL